MTFEEFKEFHDNVLAKEEWKVPAVRLFTQDEVMAILSDIQLEIEEREQYYQDKFLEPRNAVNEAAMGGRMFGCGECKEVIQQKINALKAESEAKE